MKIKICNAEGAVFVKKYKVVGIGNAVVDVISQSSDTFLQRMGIEKGIMQLIEKERAEALYDAMENRVQAAGARLRIRWQVWAHWALKRRLWGASETMRWGSFTRKPCRKVEPIL